MFIRLINPLELYCGKKLFSTKNKDLTVKVNGGFMGKQYNKVEKRRRSKQRIKRLKLRKKAATKK
ncbi:MAG: hypothetical protein ACE5HI_18080 [bacterium]